MNGPQSQHVASYLPCFAATGRKLEGAFQMNRSPRAALSPAELSALRRLAGGLSNFVPKQHRRLLLSMGLIQVNEAGRETLTEEGLLRLGEKNKRSPSPTANR